MIGKHHCIRFCKKLCHFGIGNIAIDERDSITILTSFYKVGRQFPSLPGLTNDSEPISRDLVLRQGIERFDEIFEPLKWPNYAKKQEITA